MRGWKDSRRLQVGHYCHQLNPSADVVILDLLHENRLYGHAAEYYVKATLNTKAALCYHLDGQYEQAAAILRQGGHFDDMVTYVRV